jgi:thioredoxin 1
MVGSDAYHGVEDRSMTIELILILLGGAFIGTIIGQVKFKHPVGGFVVGAGVAAAVFFLVASRLEVGVAEIGEPEDFEAEVLKSDKPVLVDFYATWCPPCKKLAPTIDDLAEDYADRVKFVKVDVDKNGILAARYGIRGVPTVLLFVKGQIVDSWVGSRPEQVYRAALDRVAPK